MIASPRKTRIGLWGNLMASNFVNLDAIISREDWDAMPDQPSRDVQSPSGISFKCLEFEKSGLAFQFLKKPEFQRETASWEPEKVADLVKCFVEGDLIPSIIIWRNENSRNLFVIDGAHRLGALIAWVHDDYGDSDLSRKFFKNTIPPEQQKAAKKTRDLISASIGSYQTIKTWDSKSFGDTKEARYAFTLLTRQIVVQEIVGGSQKAEASFFKINQQAAPITPTELALIDARKKAYGIATRALVRAGTGHKFWRQFKDAAQDQIENISGEVHSLLFKPPLSNPIHIGLDLPIGGRGYSTEAVSLLLAFVNLTIAPPKKKAKRQKGVKPEEKVTPPDDLDGSETINLLSGVRKLTGRMAGKSFPSFGLHSAVYFYSATGRFQPTAFLATASLIRELETHDRLHWFTLHRGKFEQFLLGHRYLINQMVLKHGSMEKSHEPMLDLYRTILDLASQNKAESQMMDELTTKFIYLRAQGQSDFVTQEADFSYAIKNASLRKAGITKLHCCVICKAPVHPNAIQMGHQKDKKSGGTGNIGNSGIEHPFCNMEKDNLIPMFSELQST